MTYEERIAAIKLVIFVMCDNTWPTPDHPRCVEIARAADRACLAAIEEPTEAMLSAAREMRKSYDEPADIYTAMWSAIPRGDR